MRKLFKIQLISLCLVFLWGCDKEFDKHYKRPDFLKGNAIELMEDRGDFTHFIKAAEKAGYKGMLNGRELCTVMAPNDEAFEKYFARHGYSSIDDIPLETLEVLVPYHIIKNAFEETYLLGFNTTDGEPGNGRHYKYETYAYEPVKTMINPWRGNTINIYGRSKYMPIISSWLFKTDDIPDPESDYKYFFPDINWQGADDKLYAGNAAVIEAGLPTDNGYLYILDEVYEPLRTLYEAMEEPKTSDFSVFLKLYDKFAEPTVASTTGGDTLYHYNHLRRTSKSITLNATEQLPNIASQWTYHGEMGGSRPDWSEYGRWCYNCFAPNNAALELFFNEYFSGFASIQDVPQLSLYYLMRAHVREQQYITLPGVIEKGLKGVFGEEWEINRNNDIVNPEFCINGILYGMNKVLVPAHYKLVTKPLLTTPHYAITANMYYKAGQFLILTDPTPDRYTLFFQADSMLQNLGFEMDYGGNYFNDSDEKILLNNQKFLTVKDADTLQVFTDMHILTEACIRDFDNIAYYPTKEAFFYLYTGDGDIYDSNGRSYKILNSFETENGVSYEIDGIFQKPSNSAINVLRTVSEYSDLFTLLIKSGIVDAVNSKFTNLNEGERFMLFAPKNGTYDYNALDLLPEEELAILLNYLFIPADINNLTEYVLPNLGTAGTYQTLAKDEENSTIIKDEYLGITISFVDNQRIRLTNNAGNQEIYTDGSVPFFVTDGLIYPIESFFKAQ